MTKNNYLTTHPCMLHVDASFTVKAMMATFIKDESAHAIYQRPSKDRPVAVHVGEFTYYVGLPCSQGNGKIAHTCLVTKLLPIVTCPNCKSCMGKCYALKDTYRYPAVYVKELLYTFLATVDPMAYVDLIASQIEKTHAETVRLHEAGDFFSLDYVNAILALCARFPRVKFFTYTKTAYPLPAPNLNIVDSMIEWQGETIPNFGAPELIDEISKATGYPICPCGNGSAQCMGTCNLCSKLPHVLFYEH